MHDELREELLSLCTRAYGEDFSSYLRLLSPALHVLAYVDKKLVSHAAWVERELRAEHVGPLRTAYVEAVATRARDPYSVVHEIMSRVYESRTPNPESR